MKNQKLIFLLNEEDKKSLIKIYYLRFLTTKQMYDYQYRSIYQSLSEFNDQVVDKLLNLNIIEIVLFQHYEAGVFLTTLGVDIVRELLNLPTNIVTTDKKVIKRGYFRASDLKVLPQFMNHQAHLNAFVLGFEKEINKKYPQLPYHYYDEKHMSSYDLIRPDGMIQLLNYDIFLEMDMNKESKKQLEQKWLHYRSYFAKNQYYHQERQILVLFICEGINQVQGRAELVQHTAFNFIGDLFCPEFDLIIGQTDELIHLLVHRLIPRWKNEIPKENQLKTFLNQHLNFNFIQPHKLHQTLRRNGYEYFIKHKSNHPFLEFLFDDWRLLNLSVLNTLALHRKNNFTLSRKGGKPLKYLLLIDDEDITRNWLAHHHLLREKDVYFTTLERLKTLPLYQAIFVFNERKEIFHFTDQTFSKLQKEKNTLS